MKKLSEMPFISVSQENLKAAKDMLNRQEKGELLEMLIEAVTEDGAPSSENRYVQGIFNQFMAVIQRKADGYSNRVKALDKFNAERKSKSEDPQVSTYTQTATEEPMVNIQLQAQPRMGKDESYPTFRTQGELVEYLVDYSKTHSKYDVEMFRNYRCKEYGFNVIEVMNELKERIR